jgi:ketol-acid reductoisomerase
VDLIYEGGFTTMYYSVSNTAHYGGLSRGKRVLGEASRKAMQELLKDVQSGQFAKEWILENQAHRPVFRALTRDMEEHPIEKVGRDLRKMMPWLLLQKKVDRDKA